MNRAAKISLGAGGVLLALVAVTGGVFAALLSPDIEVQQAAPAATFTGVDGKTISLDQLEGKVVLLDFWAST